MQAALDGAPPTVFRWELLGRAHMDRAGEAAVNHPGSRADLRQAEECFRRILELDPGHRNARMRLNSVRQKLPVASGTS